MDDDQQSGGSSSEDVWAKGPLADSEATATEGPGLDEEIGPQDSIPAARPLDGVLVVDLSRYLPGPLVGRLLGDLGARVIKVEEPRLGDPSRHAPPLVNDRSSLASILLAGHESLALDLSKPTARDLLEDLLMSADVLVESYRPGKLKSFGLDPEELRGTFPSLIICSVTGWGQDGAHAWKAGHDLGYQAVAGSLAAGGGMPAVQVADIVGGWSGALAVTSALHRRAQTGEGCWIDQALLDAASHAALTAWSAEADGPKAVAEPLMLTGGIPCYDLYRTRDDGTLAMAALEPKFWVRFCTALDRKDLIPKQFDSDPKARRQVVELIGSRTRDEWSAFFDQHDIPAEPVLSLSEALEHPQVKHRGLVTHDPDGLPRLGYPARIDGERPRSASELPGLGEQTPSLLQEFGLATGLSSFGRRRAGVGKRFSVRRWATRAATKWATRSKKKT